MAFQYNNPKVQEEEGLDWYEKLAITLGATALGGVGGFFLGPAAMGLTATGGALTGGSLFGGIADASIPEKSTGDPKADAARKAATSTVLGGMKMAGAAQKGRPSGTPDPAKEAMEQTAGKAVKVPSQYDVDQQKRMTQDLGWMDEGSEGRHPVHMVRTPTRPGQPEGTQGYHMGTGDPRRLEKAAAQRGLLSQMGIPRFGGEEPTFFPGQREAGSGFFEGRPSPFPHMRRMAQRAPFTAQGTKGPGMETMQSESPVEQAAARGEQWAIDELKQRRF